MNRCSFCEWIPILPWPVCPLAGHARLGQNTVVGSMTILLSWLCWGACQEEVCLDPRCPVQPHSTTVSCGATTVGINWKDAFFLTQGTRRQAWTCPYRED